MRKAVGGQAVFSLWFGAKPVDATLHPLFALPSIESSAYLSQKTGQAQEAGYTESALTTV